MILGRPRASSSASSLLRHRATMRLKQRLSLAGEVTFDQSIKSID
jgi:hypothetical protein